MILQLFHHENKAFCNNIFHLKTQQLSLLYLFHVGKMLVAIDFLILPGCSSAIAGVNFSMLITTLSIANALPRVPTIRKSVKKKISGKVFVIQKELFVSVVISVHLVCIMFMAPQDFPQILVQSGLLQQTEKQSFTYEFLSVSVFHYQEQKMCWHQHTCLQSCRWKCEQIIIQVTRTWEDSRNH